jgi:class 3 adenylate cyclase
MPMLRLFGLHRPDLVAAFAVLEEQGRPAEQGAALAAFFAQADPSELLRLNPRRIAEQLRLAERTTLRLLVAALYAGLVDLHWDVRCPICGAINHRGDSIAGLHHDDQCANCRARFAVRLDDEVRVSFSLAARLHPRPARDDAERRAATDARLGPVPGHALLLLPEFQALFPAQRLLPDESLDVTRAALLFTDLAGSTAIYARRGDARAYHLVRLHFDELFRVADEHGGLMVKTIGDAVMAAFQRPVEALQAALVMQAAINDLNRRANLQPAERLILKVGLHSGPCLSVTLNDRPDYFGTTVNIAARVQGLSHGDDILLTDTIHRDAEAAPLLAGRRRSSASVTLKGIAEPVVVHRLTEGLRAEG